MGLNLGCKTPFTKYCVYYLKSWVLFKTHDGVKTKNQRGPPCVS